MLNKISNRDKIFLVTGVWVTLFIILMLQKFPKIMSPYKNEEVKMARTK